MDRATASLKERYPVALDDGRGFLPDKIGFAMPAGMRDALCRAAAKRGLSLAGFIREAVDDRLKHLGHLAASAEN